LTESEVSVGFGVFFGLGVLDGLGVLVGFGVFVGFGVLVGLGVFVGFDDLEGEGESFSVSEAVVGFSVFKSVVWDGSAEVAFSVDPAGGSDSVKSEPGEPPVGSAGGSVVVSTVIWDG